MHPISTMKAWPHERPDVPYSDFFDRLSHWTQSDSFWIVLGLVVLASVLILSIYLLLEFGPTYTGDQFNSLPIYFTMGLVR